MGGGGENWGVLGQAWGGKGFLRGIARVIVGWHTFGGDPLIGGEKETEEKRK